MKRLNVLMIYGGESSEHEVSLASAKNVVAAVDKQKFNLLLCYIDTSGRWWLHDEWHDDPDGHRDVQLVAAPGAKSMLTIPGSKVLNIDVMYPILHGKMGEDGTIQGLARMLHIPMVGCGVESSALCMNKDAAKRLLEAEGIPVVPWIILRKGFDAKTASKEAKKLSATGPWFVKPARAGSSVGVSKVVDIKELHAAILAALEHDDSALVEVAVSGRELEVAVLGNVPTHKASGVGEILPGNDFYDYSDKYDSSSESKVVLDAKLPKALTKVIQQYALEAYTALGCAGMSRVDFLLSDDLVPYLNEVNTLPGFTDISMYPKLWSEKNISQTELIDRLIRLSLE